MFHSPLSILHHLKKNYKIKLGLIWVLAISFLLLFTSFVLAEDRVYWDEIGDTIYVSSFPARVDLHMRFDNDDTLELMSHPFTWTGSIGVDSVIQKSCIDGWFMNSAANCFDLYRCRFDPPDKQLLYASRYGGNVTWIAPGTHYLYAVWSFMVGQENAVLCMDTTFMPPNYRFYWRTFLYYSRYIYPQYTKKSWIIAWNHCGDANLDNVVDVGDLVYLINYTFFNGPLPVGPCDVNNDGIVDIGDITFLIDYVFYTGPKPDCGQM